MIDKPGRRLVALARHAIVFELRLYASLLRWVLHRPAVPDTGVVAVGYAQAVTPVMWLWIFASAVEIPLFHLLIPWHTVRIIGLALGVWGLLWMVGFLASLNVHPHLVDDSRIRIRQGSTVDIAVPWELVESISSRRRDLTSTIRSLQPRETDAGTNLQVGVSGQVNVHLRLRDTMTVPTRDGDLEVVEFSLLVDDPRAFVARARTCVAA